METTLVIFSQALSRILTNINDYTMFGPYYDDGLMKQAFDDVVATGEWGAVDYHNPNPFEDDWKHHDCQDFAKAWRDKYANLGGKTCSVPSKAEHAQRTIRTRPERSGIDR